MDYRSVLMIGLVLELGVTSSGAIAQPLLLPPTEITEHLQTLPNWTTDGQTLQCTFQFETFVESVDFVNQLVEPAELLGHHPDIAIAYNRVTVSFTTHDAGGLTQLDFEGARAIADPCPAF